LKCDKTDTRGAKLNKGDEAIIEFTLDGTVFSGSPVRTTLFNS